MASYDDTATVSGSVVGFSNGADSVPLKNWLVTLPASLSGYSAIGCTQINSDNLMSFPSVDFTYKNVRYYTVDGVLYLDGTSTGETSPAVDEFKALCFTLKAGTYYFNRGSLALPSYIYKKSDGTQLRVNNGSFTLSEDTECNFGFYVYNKTFSNSKADLCLNIGITAITYEDTTAPTTATASLGRTIYGGTADIVTGEGSDNCIRIQIKNRTWGIVTVGSFQVFSCNKITTKEANFNFQVEGYENAETYRNYLLDKQCGTYNTTNAMDRIVIRDDSYTTVEDFLTAKGDNYIVYENTSPTTFTFDPITPTPETALGVNNFWSDEGDSELTYYKDGYGFTSVTIHKETPEGEPVEQTAKLHKIVYGGLVDVISGKAEPKNLFDSADASHTFLSGTNTQYQIGTISLKGGVTYTFSAKQEDDLTSNTRNTLVIYDNGTYTYEYGTGTNYHNQSGVHSMQYTPNADKTVTLIIWVHTPSNDVTYSEFQVEKGSSASDFAPYFDPFSFPPISMETDEGENTLYADQGDSAIVYRKAVE